MRCHRHQIEMAADEQFLFRYLHQGLSHIDIDRVRSRDGETGDITLGEP